ncbi:MAG: tyrosine-type recombinase/integrase, partial [Candidatus Hydrogenedentes bacterium]|nr:tyrosine-type recombinase/integrase [Candidatus Hydrogenedentota bacterium]
MSTLWQKTKNGTWYVSYRDNGRQKVRSLKTCSRRTALKLRDEFDALLKEGLNVNVVVSPTTPSLTKNPSIDMFWTSLSTWLETHRSPSTVEEYKNWFNQITEFTQAKYLGDIAASDIEAFKISLLRQGKLKPKGTGLKKTSINDALKSLEAIWNHAIKLGLFTGENPASSIERFRIPKNDAEEYLDKEEIQALLTAAKNYADERFIRSIEAKNVYLAIALAALAGLRKREVCFARWEWIDWRLRILRVRNEEDFLTKNRKSRVVSINQQLLDILTELRKEEGYI